jgi:SHS2 domain-containing protein
VKVRPVETVAITCTAPSAEVLLYDWLNALILEMAKQNLLFGRFEVTVNGHHLAARA